ncbi:secreted peptidase [Minicystis rosea]|nr:secreted peptidase [Minicystis rosea]
MTPTSSRLRQALGWLPLTVLAVSAASAWWFFLRGGMRSVLAWLALQIAVPAVTLVVVVGTIVHAVWTRRRMGRLAATLALASVCLWPAGWIFGLLPIAYPFDLAATSPAATVRLPTRAPMRVVWGGDDVKHNRHAAFPDQRWAYDLGVDPMLVGSSRLEDYGCWNVPVVAPTSGTIHVAHDGEPDHEPGKLSFDTRAPLGNHVVIALPTGTFLIVAHLRNGSVVAREGEPVLEGAPLGACGNSGNTSEPHVHIHHQRQDPRGRPINFSEGLPLFFRGHDGAPMPLGGIDASGIRPRPSGATVRDREGATATSGDPCMDAHPR